MTVKVFNYSGKTSGGKEAFKKLGKSLGKAGKAVGHGLYKVGSATVHAAHEAKVRKVELAKARKEAGLPPPKTITQKTFGVINTGTKAVDYHRQRRLAKLNYKNERAKLVGAVQQQRAINKETRPTPPGIRPLGDKQFGINPSRRLGAGIQKVKGSPPLGDKGLNKKINLNKSNGGFFNKKM